MKVIDAEFEVISAEPRFRWGRFLFEAIYVALWAGVAYYASEPFVAAIAVTAPWMARHIWAFFAMMHAPMRETGYTLHPRPETIWAARSRRRSGLPRHT